MEELHYIGKVRQSGLIVAEDTGRAFITRDARSDTWELPGGRLHKGEVPVEGFCREIQEELGITVTVKRILRTELMLHSHSSSETFFVVYEVSVPTEAMPFVLDPVEASETRWVGKNDYAEIKLFPDARTALDMHFNESVPN